MTWNQVYNPLGNLGLSALVAAIPLFILLYMLGVRRSKGHYAAFVATLPPCCWPLSSGACRWVWRYRRR